MGSDERLSVRKLSKLGEKIDEKSDVKFHKNVKKYHKCEKIEKISRRKNLEKLIFCEKISQICEKFLGFHIEKTQYLCGFAGFFVKL